MNYTDLIGRTLDEKYHIERELGRGGMGTVYLATHLGTERPVAIKVIAPQFMKRAEFVERFRREAKAAGRLRHPNVVDVTDFGFAHTSEGEVAYLVMEYLDGCTLGEILEEEKNLPVSWTLDILEQVCSAVHEAHEQGIIHRDLKPDNIWLEPNQRGGYTVKVLDFGIAKLEAHETAADTGEHLIGKPASPTFAVPGGETIAGHRFDATIHDSISPTKVGEGATAVHAVRADPVPADRETLIQSSSNGEEAATQILNDVTDAEPAIESVRTKLLSSEYQSEERKNEIIEHLSLVDSSASSDLTRVGAVLGTPLYMSPEQCRGDRLDARSDIYSLGVIAYQMLSGDTPFRGDFTRVMESHKLLTPPPLNAKKVRPKLKKVINGALAKDPAHRPQTAEAFASSLRSRSEGIFGLLRRASMIYTEHMPKFLLLSTFYFLPIIAITVFTVALGFLSASEVVPQVVSIIGIGVAGISSFLVTAFCAYLITGTITWIVAQMLAVPLRPIKLRAALVEARKKWKTFAGLGILTTLMIFLSAGVAGAAGFGLTFGLAGLVLGYGGAAGAIGGLIGVVAAIAAFLYISVWLMLTAPVAMMENQRGWKAMKRSKALISRSLVTAFAAFIIMFMIPMFAAGTLSFFINTTAKAYRARPAAEQTQTTTTPAEDPRGVEIKSNGEGDVNITFGTGNGPKPPPRKKDMRERLIDTFLETLVQILLLPIQIVVISFTAIIVALLYLKTRQAGGESLQDLLGTFEETERPRKKWQERVRQRLIQSGRITSRS